MKLLRVYYIDFLLYIKNKYNRQELYQPREIKIRNLSGALIARHTKQVFIAVGQINICIE